MTTTDTKLGGRGQVQHAGGRASEPPGVRSQVHGPESAGDDAALIQRKASFDTRRADRALVLPEETAPRATIRTPDASVAQR
jgi:hypothetical protein